jgi:hypothetical protein
MPTEIASRGMRPERAAGTAANFPETPLSTAEMQTPGPGQPLFHPLFEERP